MTSQERDSQFFFSERTRKLNSIELLQSGKIGTHEMRDGVQIDTTGEAIAKLQEQVDELDKIITDSGGSIDIITDSGGSIDDA